MKEAAAPCPEGADMSDEPFFLRLHGDDPDDDRPTCPGGADANEESGFRRRLRDQPDDDGSRQSYADWLEARGDPRAEYLRLESQLLAIPRRLAQLREGIDPQWLADVGRPRSRIVELVRYRRTQKIYVVGIVMRVTGMSLREAGALVEGGLPATIKDQVAVDEAVQIWRLFDGIAEVVIRPHWECMPSPPPRQL